MLNNNKRIQFALLGGDIHWAFQRFVASFGAESTNY